MKASTHLLLKEPDGNKYEAACRWDVPCVSKDWLFACAANRKLMPMDAYPLKRAEEDELEENTEEPAKNEEELAKDREDGKDEMELEHEVIEDPEIDAKEYEIPVQKAELKMRSSDKVSPDKEKVADAGDYEVPMEVFDDKDFVNIDDHQNQPQLNLTKSFRPSFDLSDAMEALNSPNSSFVQRRKSRASRGSFPLDNLFNENIQKAVKRTQPAGIDLLKETKKSKECADRKETVTTEDNIDQVKIC